MKCVWVSGHFLQFSRVNGCVHWAHAFFQVAPCEGSQATRPEAAAADTPSPAPSCGGLSRPSLLISPAKRAAATTVAHGGDPRLVISRGSRQNPSSEFLDKYHLFTPLFSMFFCTHLLVQRPASSLSVVVRLRFFRYISTTLSYVSSYVTRGRSAPLFGNLVFLSLSILLCKMCIHVRKYSI